MPNKKPAFKRMRKEGHSLRILKFALKHPGYTSRDIATELRLPQSIVSTALIQHVNATRLTRVPEGRVYRYWPPSFDKGSTDGGGA